MNPLSSAYKLSRRTFLGTAAVLPVLPSLGQTQQKRIAIITTVYRPKSHANHMGDRFLVGYPHNGEWHMPDMKVVSLYVDQKPDNDLSQARAEEFGFKVYPTIAETLRCGGNKLAVDAILIIGEQGVYPINAKGQLEIPRYEFFEQCVKVFQQDGRAVPVYNDKHLSYSFTKAKKMVDWSKELGFPMLGGSSLPVTWRLPDIEMPYGAEIEDVLMIGENDNTDKMSFHALEAMQCMVERRMGGETGVKAVQMLEGEAVWNAGWSKELLVSALSRTDTLQGLTAKDGREQDVVANGELKKMCPKPGAYMIEYNDGLRATMLNLQGAIADFNFAARVKGHGIISNQFLLTPDPNFTYSACLIHKAEQMFATGVAPYPIERTLLTSGMLEACHNSRFNGSSRLLTPLLDVKYHSPKESQYCRA